MLKYDGIDYFAIIEESRLLLGKSGEIIFELDPVSSVDGSGRVDEELNLSAPDIRKNGENWEVGWTAESTLWEKKEYVFILTPRCAEYYVRVFGKGTVDKIEYFIGDRKKPFHGSSFEAADYFAPLGLANAASPNRIFTTAQRTHLGISGGWSPTPLAFSFRTAEVEGRLLLGLAALPGNASFDGLTYRTVCFAPDIAHFCLEADFNGYRKVDGYYESPAILALGAEEDLSALRKYAEWHYDRGLPKTRTENAPLWWKGPFFCGWKEQAVAEGYSSPFEAANQKCYSKMCETLDERGLRPSAIIIDDKWQSEYGVSLPDREKWPDMRSFIEEQHKKGRRVVLWFKSWDAEGLPDEECILDENGKRLGADPTSPAYRKRVRSFMHTLLSDGEGCMNADGFKVDFSDCIPKGKNLRIHEDGVYGISLLHRFMELLYTETKRVKPDALFNTSCCHPLFAGFTDQARLHDNYFPLRDSPRIMKERAEIFDSMMPGISIDTDAGSCGSRRDFMRYARSSGDIGVPDIYVLNPVEDCALSGEDWEEIRSIWENYRKKNGLS